MSGSRRSRLVTAHSLVVAGVSFAHSLRTRGLRRTLLFAAPGTAIPILGELLAIKGLRLLRHHARPQAGGVPLAVALGWYNVGYGTLAVVESIMDADGPDDGASSWVLAPATALTATSLDLLLDPYGLDLGLWEWTRGGRYAAEIQGPNDNRGIPLLNYAGWLALITSVTLAFRLLDSEHNPPNAAAARSAALLLLSYYLPAAAWALERRRPKYLLYSAPFALALWMAWGGRE